jgi:chromosomal replication initiation ATPase DnaA
MKQPTIRNNKAVRLNGEVAYQAQIYLDGKVRYIKACKTSNDAVKVSQSVIELMDNMTFEEAKNVVINRNKSMSSLLIAAYDYVAKQEKIIASFKKKEPVPSKDYSILPVVCQILNVKMEHVLGKSRAHNLSKARRIACYFMRNLNNYTYMKIGDIMNMNHESVMYHERVFRALYEMDAEFKSEIGTIATRIILANKIS